MTGYRIADRLRRDAAAERRRLVEGLRSHPATIEPKYFYDELGCALYAAICQLDEYYPTRTERAIFDANRAEITACVGAVDTLVDLGAGDSRKAEGWLPYIRPSRYLAVDIAAAALESALARLERDYPEIELCGLATDFSHQLEVPQDLLFGRSVFFYPGSSIGNFAPEAARRFLAQIRSQSSGGLLIGVDAKKDAARLTRAYDDALGVTSAFNLNALRHVNRVLGCNFREQDWRHVGLYDGNAGRVEMHLESIRDQLIMIDGQTRRFAAGERIHSENSYKYSREEFRVVLETAGFSSVRCWTDASQAFWVFYAN